MTDRARRCPSPRPRYSSWRAWAPPLNPSGDHAAVVVWLEADDAVRKERALSRDGDVFAREWDRWAGHEEELFGADHVRDRADVVVDTTAWSERTG